MSLPQDNATQQVHAVKGSFLFGSTFEILQNPVAFLSNLSKNYGPVVTVRFGGRKYYVLQHPDYVRHVWLENYKQYRKPGATKLLRMFLGEGLSTSNGELWLRQRRLMQPAFHSKKLQYFTDIINEEVTAFINRLNEIPDNTKIDITHEFLKLTIRIISRSMFGMHFDEEISTMVNALDELASYAAAWMMSPVKIPTNWPTPANKFFQKNCKVFDTIIHRVIDTRRNEIATGRSSVNSDLLDMLLNSYDEETKSPINEKLLRDEVVTIFMAGHETTAQTLSWMFYHLAKEKEINEKVKAESRIISNNKPLLFEDIAKLIYSRQVIQETLRLYPPIWAVVRQPIKDDTIREFHLRKQSNVLLNIYGLHHHPNYWEQPENFYPEHFSVEKEKSRPSFVYVPFGGGPRLCLGHNFAMLVMHIVLCRVVQSFEFIVPENYIPVVEPNITLRAKQGIQLIKKNQNKNIKMQ
ncbi:MAG: cytochrome P450 [Ginsengibacter sp.]